MWTHPMTVRAALATLLAVPIAPSADARTVEVALYRPDVRLYSQGGTPVSTLGWARTGRPIAMKWSPMASMKDQLENLDTAVPAPADTLPDLYRYQFVFTVDVDQRLPVLTKPVVFTNDKGLETHVLPGVPVHQADGRWVLGSDDSDGLADQIRQAGDHASTLTPTDDQVGRSLSLSPGAAYLGGPKQDYCPLDHGLLQPGEACISADDPTLLLDASVFRLREHDGGIVGLVQVEPWLYQEVALKSRSEHASDTMGGVVGGPLGDGPFSVLGAFVTGPPPQLAPAQTTVYWPDGERAGVVRQEHRLDFHATRPGKDGLRCYLRHPGDVPAQLCFRDGDLQPTQ